MHVDEDEDFEIINGKRVLRDQHRIRVRLADAKRSRDRSIPLTDGRGAPHMVGHRPGFVIDASRAARDAKAKAYEAYEHDLANRWRTRDDDPNGAGSSGPIGQREGDLCTLNGFPGVLRPGPDGKLVCVVSRQNFAGSNGPDEDEPDAASDSIKDAKQRLAELYRQRDLADANAWRRS
jgi:hypothetical protein